MKYQVSCDIIFTAESDRDTVYAYLDGKRESAFLVSGDLLSIEDTASGGYRVSCLFRLMAFQFILFYHHIIPPIVVRWLENPGTLCLSAPRFTVSEE